MSSFIQGFIECSLVLSVARPLDTQFVYLYFKRTYLICRYADWELRDFHMAHGEMIVVVFMKQVSVQGLETQQVLCLTQLSSCDLFHHGNCFHSNIHNHVYYS